MRTYVLAGLAVALVAAALYVLMPGDGHAAAFLRAAPPDSGLLHAGLFAGIALRAGMPALPRGVIFADLPTIDDLKAQIVALTEEWEGIVADSAEHDGDLTEDQEARIAEIRNLIARKQKQIENRPPVSIAGSNRRTERPAPGRVEPQARREDPRGGFTNGFGEFATAVRYGSIQGNTPDARLIRNAQTTYGSEGTGADGGFLVPQEFAREIWQKVQAEENLLNRCAPLVTSVNNMTIPKDETTPWQSSGGVQVYWEGEAASMTPSKPAFESATAKLVKLTALVPVTEENLEDAVGLESWLRAKAPAKMAAKINTAIIRGTGVGQPLGILKSPSLISVAKETSQVGDSIYFANINKMWSRCYAGWRRNAIWLINQDIEPQLEAMAFDPAADSKVPVYLPPGGVADSPYARLKGRPVVPVEACSTLGDQGDIILVDLMQYWAITKGTGIKTDVSMHLYFDQALTTFRFIFRLNGMPAWSSVITPENGNTTRSWAVTLDERS